MIHEMINLYGVPVKLLLTDKIDRDATVFGDYSSVKVDKEKVFDLMALQENSETWDDGAVNFSEFGLMNIENVRMFVSSKSVHEIFDGYKPNGDEEFMPIHGLQNNLVILPNDKIMEITHVDFQVPGMSNLYTYKDDKNVYKISLKPYYVKLQDDLSALADDVVSPGTYDNLDKYFEEMTNNFDTVEKEAKVDTDIDSQKVVVVEADSVFGRF